MSQVRFLPGGLAAEVLMLPDKHVLAAYAVGNDLEAVAPVLRKRFLQYIAEEHWPTGAAVFVDQVHDPDPTFPDWPPDWDLGVNLGLDRVLQSPGWFAGVELLIGALRLLAAETGREFDLSLCFWSEPWRQEELVLVGPAEVDLAWLRETIERLTARRS